MGIVARIVRQVDAVAAGGVVVLRAGVDPSEMSPSDARSLAAKLSVAADAAETHLNPSVAPALKAEDVRADVGAFIARYEKDGADALTGEQWNDWVNTLTMPEFLGMIMSPTRDVETAAA